MTDWVGKTLGAYEIKQQIGRGGIATVFEAYHAPTERSVAVKVLLPDMAQDADFRTRFDREAKTVAGLQHIHILPVFDYGQEGDTAYLVMPYIKNGTLSDAMRNKVFTPTEALTVTRQLGSALDYAHKQGILHRDLKPSNVLLDDSDNPLLADFGLLRLMDDASKLTQSNIIGTPAYMSPEQGQGMPLDARSDIYAFGVMVYELFVGEVPFQAPTPVAVIYKHVADPIPKATDVNPKLPASLDAVLEKAMAKQAVDRYGSARELVTALEVALGQEHVTDNLRQSAVSVTPQPKTDNQSKITETDHQTFVADLNDATEIIDHSDVIQADDATTRSQPMNMMALGVGLMGLLFAGLSIALGIYILSDDGNTTITNNGFEYVALQVNAHEGAGLTLDFNPDGSQLVTGGADNMARIWDANNGALLFDLEIHTGDVTAAGFHPTDGWLLTGGADTMSYQWSANTGEVQITNFAGGTVKGIAFDSDGIYDAYVVPSQLIVNQAGEDASEVIISDFDESIQRESLAISPNGAFVFVGLSDGSIQVWDTEITQQWATISPHESAVVAISADKDHIASVDDLGNVSILAIEGFEPLVNFETDEAPSSIALQETLLALAGDAGVSLWNWDEQSRLATLSEEPNIDVAFRPNHDELASVNIDGVFTIWDIDDFE